MLAYKLILIPSLFHQTLQWTIKDLIGIFVIADPPTPLTCQDAFEVAFGDNDAFVKTFCQEGNAYPALWRGHWNQLTQDSISYGGPGFNDTKVSISITSKDEIMFGKARLIRATKTTNLDTLALLGFSTWTSDNATFPLTKLVFTEGKVAEHRGTTINTYEWKIAGFGPSFVLGGYLANPNNLTHVTRLEIMRLDATKIGYNGQLFSLSPK